MWLVLAMAIALADAAGSTLVGEQMLSNTTKLKANLEVGHCYGFRGGKQNNIHGWCTGTWADDESCLTVIPVGVSGECECWAPGGMTVTKEVRCARTSGVNCYEKCGLPDRPAPTPPAPGSYCKGWQQTGNCDKDGPKQKTEGCFWTAPQDAMSGYCMCGNGQTRGARDCFTYGIPDRTCNYACRDVKCDETMPSSGGAYRGCQTKTMTGRTCQEWRSQSPHSHNRHPSDNPSKALDNNYCRNPEGEARPWCYTADPNVRFEYCSPIGVQEDPEYYLGAPGTTCLGEYDVIRSQSECTEALKYVGRQYYGFYTSSVGGIPAGCSVRKPGGDGKPHFETSSIGLGRGRSDLQPICKGAGVEFSKVGVCEKNGFVSSVKVPVTMCCPAVCGGKCGADDCASGMRCEDWCSPFYCSGRMEDCGGCDVCGSSGCCASNTGGRTCGKDHNSYYPCDINYEGDCGGYTALGKGVCNSFNGCKWNVATENCDVYTDRPTDFSIDANGGLMWRDGYVCNRDFNEYSAARMVCSELGLRYISWSEYTTPYKKFSMDRLECPMGSTWIKECTYKPKPYDKDLYCEKNQGIKLTCGSSEMDRLKKETE